MASKELSKEYDIDSDTIYNDLEEFLLNLYPLLSEDLKNNVNLDSHEVLNNEKLIFNKTSERLIPFTAVFEVTNKCNLSCIHCYRPEEPKETIWSVERFKSVLSELKNMGCLNIDFTGGEPFIHSDFRKLVEIACNEKFVVSILTNGTQVNLDDAIFLSSHVIKNIYISLYSLDDDIHDEITQVQGSCKKTKQAIELLLKNNINVAINTPIMINNKNSVRDISIFAKSLSIPVEFSFKITNSYNKKNNTIENLNCFDYEFLSNLVHDNDIKLYEDVFKRIKTDNDFFTEQMCQAGFRSITFDFQGNVFPCTALRFPLGNINNSSFSDIWSNSTSLNNWRKSLNKVPKKCFDCNKRAYCEPCYGSHYAKTGDLGDIDKVTCNFGDILYRLSMSLPCND